MFVLSLSVKFRLLVKSCTLIEFIANINVNKRLKASFTYLFVLFIFHVSLVVEFLYLIFQSDFYQFYSITGFMIFNLLYRY